MSRLIKAGLILVAAIGLFGVHAFAGDATSSATVTIDNFSFTPGEVIVAPGTTVTWTNHDDIPHTVTSADEPRLFKSSPLDTDEKFSFRFDHAGRFRYFCSLHAHMQGMVIVQ